MFILLRKWHTFLETGRNLIKASKPYFVVDIKKKKIKNEKREKLLTFKKARKPLALPKDNEHFKKANSSQQK